jgi:HSP20 family protein
MSIKDLVPWTRSKREVAAHHEAANPIGSLQLAIDRAFEDFWRAFDVPMLGGEQAGFAGAALPKVDIRQNDREVEVMAELPGMNEADVDVSIAEGLLTIRGERKAERDTEEKGYIRRERSFGRIERMVPLPDGLDLNSATATFKNGVLTVAIAKTAEAREAVKRIPVQRG